ncbi:hypothetical protein [Leisingera sp. HS039]|uniref:hypothetical protein n=1 Tax=Leisingera sp. HS039 TaxID=2818496 RepID=UPI001FFCF80E|nr:hypothetical protein [Leisingera sp. HS039]
MRKLELRLHDTSLGIWQDNADDPTFRDEVYSELIRQMRGRGWSIKAAPQTKKHYPTLSPDHRIAAKGTLLASVELTGRVVKLEFWSTTARQSNPNGRRYDFDKLERMAYLDQKRFALEKRRIMDWLVTISELEITASRSNLSKFLTALERIEAHYAGSRHTKAELGRPVCDQDYNRKSRDGHLIEHGQTIWFTGRDGRIRRGTAFYNINNMWWVTDGTYGLRNLSCHEIRCHQPAQLRTKQNARERRKRLERELANAIHCSNYRRADLLHKILFGNEPAFLIWSRKNDAFYAPDYCGYTSDAIRAGRYTREEAEAEVKRVPHHLEMVCPDGKRVRFDKQGEAA